MPATADLDAILRAMDELERTRVLVGIPAEKDERQDSPVGNAAIAYWQNFGVPEINLPAREFMVLDAAMPDITAGMENAGKAAANGNMALAEQTLNAVGMAGRDELIRVISSNLPPPLAASTIRNRRRRSKGSTYRRQAMTAADVVSLIDSGQLKASLSYVIRKT